MTTGSPPKGEPAWRRFLNQPFIRSIGGVGGAAGLSQLAAIAVTPLLSRLYEADAFGHFGVITAYCNIAAAFLLFGLNDAIFAAQNDASADRLLAAGLKAAAAALVPVGLFSAFVIHQRYFGLGSLPMMALAAIVPLVFILVVSSLLQASLARRLKFAPLAAGYVAMGWSRAAAQLLFGALGTAFGGLVGGEILGRTIAGRMMAKGFGASVRGLVAMPFDECWAMVQRYRHFPIHRTPSTLLSAIAVGMPMLMTTSLFGAGVGGQFGMMMTMLMGPIAIVQRAIGDTFVGHFGARYRTDRASARRFAVGVGSLALLGGAGAGTVLWFFGEFVFVLVFGHKWQAAGQMAALCAPWVALMLPVAAVSQVLIITHRPGLKLLFDILFVSGLAALQFTYSHAEGSADPLAFVRILSLICAAAYALYIPLIAYALWRPGSIADG